MSKEPSNKELSDILDRLLHEHKWMERVAIKYIQQTMTYYVDEDVDYEKYIAPFLRILEEELLFPHYRFEEEVVFPLFPNDPLIDALLEEHRKIEKIINEFRVGGGQA